MLAPMALLAGLCLLAGVGAPLLLRLVGPVVVKYAAVSPARFVQLTGIVPLQQLALVNGLLLSVMLVVWLGWRTLAHQTPPAAADTWGCGYLAPTPRMQYTGSSFTDLVAGLFGGLVGARSTLAGLAGYFPVASRLSLVGTERILDRMIIPFLLGADWCLAWLRRMQGGYLHLYILYVFATLFVLMVWSHL